MATQAGEQTIEATARALKALLAPRRVVNPVPNGERGSVSAQVPESTVPPHFIDKGGLILKRIDVWLIFWGKAWAMSPTPSVQEIKDAAAAIFAGGYMSGLGQYRGIEGGTLQGSTLVTDSDPPSPFSASDVTRLIHKQLEKGIPEPDENPSVVYCVIMPPGVSSDQPGVIGEHSFFTYYDLTDLSLPLDFDISRAHYAWVTNDGSLDGVTTILSHELVETCTDPNGDGFQGVPGTCGQTGWCEIGDVCSTTEVRDGVRVQSYWSEAEQACVVPGAVEVEVPAPDAGPEGGPAASMAASMSGATAIPPGRHLRSRYAGGLLATAWLAPIAATVVMVAAYAAPSVLPPWAALLADSPAFAGSLVGIGFWLLVAAVYAPLASAVNANVSSYSDLRERWTRLSARLATLPSGSLMPGAYLEACQHRDFITAELQGAGPKWVAAVGYLTLWKRLHRAEEALLHIEPRAQAVADAYFDQWRVQNSTMERSADLQADLGRARQFLEKLSAGALPPPLANGANGSNAGQPATPAIGSEAEARAILSRVRYAVNDFRDQRWAALIKARNLLMATMIITELFSWSLLALAVIKHAPADAIIAGIVFFLVGALVGLFNRLGQQATSGTMVADYSLAGVRLILTPTISGLAAIGGVVLTGMLTMSGLTGLVQPGPSGAAAAPVTLPILADIFDLNKFRIGLLLALLFGAAPALLTNRLQDLTDQYKNDLKSTEPSSGATPPPAGKSS